MKGWSELADQSECDSSIKTTDRVRLVYGITIGRSAYSFLRGQLEWFKERGYDVTLVTSPDESAKSAADREGVSLTSIPMARELSPKLDLAALISWIRELRKLQPHIVNISTPKAGLLGGLAAWLLRVPKRVYVVRGLRLEGASGLKRIILWCVEWSTHRLATDVVYVSQSLAKEGSELRLVPPKGGWVIGHGSSNGVFAEAVAERAATMDAPLLGQGLSIPTGAFVVGFVGRLNHDKGVDTLIRALSNPYINPKVHLLVIGPVEDSVLVEQLASLSIGVSTVGWTNDVWGYLSVVDTLVLPTRREGFPNVVLEAASAGIPAITTRATGAVDSVIDGETGYLIDVDDSDALTERINQLAARPELAQVLGENAAERARNDYRPEIIWQGLADILEGVASSEHAVRIQHQSVGNGR
ncbi:glycosyltransferase family 1 protein [Flaviflexus salsibiostraticola]|uniref:Glycosyltransferase family 1 protein n=1 Tax=Flaviflexus salsibiostraticola TaxID=1282737 RepID=A0A3Q8WSH6_9ACTO|nr:glycosyltransferase family 4 protein [Flaviflexus salsibiostraticola]AZN29225.1 glycosyltransferase family 1 protein [Flaviflexus salsibiostraticola]